LACANVPRSFKAYRAVQYSGWLLQSLILKYKSSVESKDWKRCTDIMAPLPLLSSPLILTATVTWAVALSTCIVSLISMVLLLLLCGGGAKAAAPPPAPEGGASPASPAPEQPASPASPAPEQPAAAPAKPESAMQSKTAAGAASLKLMTEGKGGPKALAAPTAMASEKDKAASLKLMTQKK
ncbi:hypothetical protein M514_00768, partial [Trichuris suis]